MKDKLELIKACCKDEESCEKVREIVEGLAQEVDKYKHYLDLLERSIRNDYDSILITELKLEKPGPRIVYVNDGFCRITGYSREEVVGKTPRILQGEKTDRAVLDKLKRRLKNGQSFFGHTVNYRKDGSEFINQWDIHPLTDEKGEITHWVSYQHDVTERKRSEKFLLDAQIEFDQLHEEAKTIKADLRLTGEFVSASKAFRELVDYDSEELNGTEIWSIASGSDAERFKADLTRPEKLNEASYLLSLQADSGSVIEVIAYPKLLSSDGERIVRVRMKNHSLEKRIVDMLKTRPATDKILDKKVDFTYGVKKRDGKFVYKWVSDSYANITGIPESEIKGAEVSKLIVDEDWPRVKSHLEKVLGGRSNTEIYRVKTRGGDPITVVDSANPKKSDHNEVKGVRGSVLLQISSEQTTIS